MKYVFVLGRFSALSVFEIINVLKRFVDEVEIIECNDLFLIVEVKEELDCSVLINDIGGTIKIGKIVDDSDYIKKAIKSIFESFLERTGKINFGFSLYFDKNSSFYKKENDEYSKFKNLFLENKKLLKEQGKSVRIVTSREHYLSSVIVKTNKLLTKGTEILVLGGEGDNLLIAQTCVVQSYEDYIKRDVKRPSRDLVIGMLPPKVAKMLVNFGNGNKDGVFLDPFCGAGTILQEAALLGFTNIIGSDNNEVSVSNSENNLEWVLKQFSYDEGEIDIKIEKGDVETLSKRINSNSVSNIVTEPYLGPPLKSRLNSRLAVSTMNKLKILYLKALTEMYNVLENKGQLVLISPVWYLGDSDFKFEDVKEKRSNFVFMDILSKIEELGFKNILSFSENASQLNTLKYFNNKRKSFIYGREKQRVLREMFILEK